MAKLDAKKRNTLKDSEFALPNRKYPVPDEAHARDAKARASQMENSGKLSKADKAKVDKKADQVLNKKK